MKSKKLRAPSFTNTVPKLATSHTVRSVNLPNLLPHPLASPFHWPVCLASQKPVQTSPACQALLALLIRESTSTNLATALNGCLPKYLRRPTAQRPKMCGDHSSRAAPSYFPATGATPQTSHAYTARAQVHLRNLVLACGQTWFSGVASHQGSLPKPRGPERDQGRLI